MNSIRNEAVALDTNVFVFALRKEATYPACETLLFDKQGAKKGDAVIAAHLEAAKIRYFVSENRHFLTELPASPFPLCTVRNPEGPLAEASQLVRRATSCSSRKNNVRVTRNITRFTASETLRTKAA